MLNLSEVLLRSVLLTQREIANYLVNQRNAHYHFIVKNNQPGLFENIAFYFQDRQDPDFVHFQPPEHGRIEIRKIWTTTELNGYLNFPHVEQAFLIQRASKDKKPVNAPVKSPMASPAELLSKPTLKTSLPPTAATGASKTAVITSSIGTMTKTEAAYPLAMAQKTSLGCGASPLASSNPKAYAASPKKYDSLLETYAWSLTTCG